MAKILISSIGTGQLYNGEYKKTKYSLNKQKQCETSFVAYALHQFYKFDKIYLVGTNKSIWDEAYRVFTDNPTDDIWENLYEKKEAGTIKIKDLQILHSAQAPVYAKIIDYGLDDSEIWNNFEKYLQIANEFDDNDEIYLDITHSFRSLALFSYVMTQFAQTISEKNIKIKAIFYGMLEYSYNNNGITPIVNLQLLVEIQEWIKAIDAIKRYSDFDLLNTLLENQTDSDAKIENTFKDLNNTIRMANMASMQRFIATASKKLRTIENSQNKIIKLIAPEIQKIIDELYHEKLSDFQFALAKWFYKNKNYAMSYLALFEAIITKSIELKEPEKNVFDEEVRNKIKGRIDYPYNQMFLENRGKKLENLNSISSIRHSIAHQLTTRNDTVTQDIERLEKFLEEFENYFN
jgi:CRISPR-associated Csx2 family protein